MRDSLRIYKQIFGYAFSSLSATAIDLGAFALFFWLMFPSAIENKEICTAVCSVIFLGMCAFDIIKKKRSAAVTAEENN